jgi:hypothetical protein
MSLSFGSLAKLLLAACHKVIVALGRSVSGSFAAIQGLRYLRVELWSVEGDEKHSGLPLSILCAANDEDRNYLLGLIFGDSHRGRRLGRFWIWNVAKAIPAVASGCSMIFVELLEPHRRFTRCGDGFFIPMWLLGEVDLPRDTAATHKVSGDLRRIRRHGLQFEITRDLGQLDDFYHNMHLPYITKTFGNCADPCPYERMKTYFEFSDLLVIKNQERSIAGQLIMHYKAGPFLGDMGIRDGNREYVKDGAACALYHFGLQYLQEKGCKRAWLGYSRPFLRDGVLQFKKKWSQKITDSYTNGFALHVLSYTSAVRAFLGNNPFVFKRYGRFYGAVFADGDKPLSTEDAQQIDKDYFHPGLSRLFIYRLVAEDPATAEPLPEELCERIELRSVRNLLGG